MQTGVCALLREVGLSVETEKRFQTPRGEVAIDVYAVDENSVDSIRYIVECKNWTSHIPQSGCSLTWRMRKRMKLPPAIFRFAFQIMALADGQRPVGTKGVKRLR